MEYHEDIKYWHTHGYFNDISGQVACPLISDLVTTFDDTLYDDKNEFWVPKTTLYFGHTDGVLLLQALLGLNQDTFPINHDNFQASLNRTFRLSKIDPMSSNIGFLLLNCSRAYDANPRIVTFLQERPVILPGCNELACDWNQFKEYYNSLIYCQFDEICNNYNDED